MTGDLDLYKIFHTVAYYQNISKAAAALYISQPAVSKSIKKLEDKLAIKLFTRSAKGVLLTAEGKIFYDSMDKALGIIADGEKIMSELKDKKHGVVTIGVSTILCRHFLLPRLKPFMQNYPAIQIKIINKTTFDTLQQIEQGILDFGIVSRPLQPGNHTFIALADIQDTFVASPSYLKTLRPLSPLEILSTGIFMLLETNNITRQYIDQYFLSNHLQIKPEVEINNMDLLIEFAKLGLGIAAVIKSFAQPELEDGSLMEISGLPPLLPRSVGVVFNKHKPLSLAAQSFLSHAWNITISAAEKDKGTDR